MERLFGEFNFAREKYVESNGILAKRGLHGCKIGTDKITVERY